MESLADKIREFLDIGSGDGAGRGYGRGNGSGNGSGNGAGHGFGNGTGYGNGAGHGDGAGHGTSYDYGASSGYGTGYGNGAGHGFGSGNGSGTDFNFESFNGSSVHCIDGIPTLIYRIKGNVAKGAILRNDWTLQPCFVFKNGNEFAHGKTLSEACESAIAKIFNNMPESERIKAFHQQFNSIDSYSNRDFFEWHHRLTGSCLMGREEFVLEKGINLDDKSTVDEFIKLTENSYGGSVIRKLKLFESE